MQGQYPVYLSGQPCGTLTVSPEGLFTRFEADCDFREGIFRLRLFGGNESAALGVLTPKAGRLCLSRRFSREVLRFLPQNPEYAAERAREGLPLLSWRPEPTPWAHFSSLREKNACLGAKGVLCAKADGKKILAFPAEGGFPAPEAPEHFQIINGMRYRILEL